MHRAIPRALRICASAGVIGLLLAEAARIPHVNTTTVALALVLFVVGIAVNWGTLEAFAAAIAAALGLDYFFLPPSGFSMKSLDHWVALFTFLTTALATGLLSARAKRNEAEAVQRRTEIEQLHKLTDAILPDDNADAIFERVGGTLIETLRVEAVAVHFHASGRILRSGARGDEIADGQLREAAASGNRIHNPKSSLSIVPVRAGGAISGSLGIIGAGVSQTLLTDIAERVGSALWKARVAESLRQAEVSRRADDLKSAVFDALAHEARGPLGSINIAATTLLSERPGDAAQQREMLTIIKEEVARLDRWIDEAARMGEAEAGEVVLTIAPRKVGDLVSRALEPLCPSLSGRHVSVEIEESLPMANCDAEMTQRVLNLLLDNALKYSPADGPIAISSRLEGDRVVVTVSDGGTGVPQHEQARIFEKYYRGSYHSSSMPGTGLGLASARYLVERQGGEIWVTNRAEGGAAFHFSLPPVKGAEV